MIISYYITFNMTRNIMIMKEKCENKIWRIETGYYLFFFFAYTTSNDRLLKNLMKCAVFICCLKRYKCV